VDADTGEEVSNEDITKGYKVDSDTYVEVSKDELENIALESTRTIDIDEFVPKSSIDPRYLIRPYYLVPDGKVGHDAFAVIRETIRSMDKASLDNTPRSVRHGLCPESGDRTGNQNDHSSMNSQVLVLWLEVLSVATRKSMKIMRHLISAQQRLWIPFERFVSSSDGNWSEVPPRFRRRR
jgi:hypothetical protein